MSAPRDYIESFKDMLAEAKFAQQFVRWVDYETFITNPEKQRAVLHSIALIGEAASNIPDTIRQHDPQIEWRDIIGMRHRLIHGYSGVNLETVWAVVLGDLPTLQAQLESILRAVDLLD